MNEFMQSGASNAMHEAAQCLLVPVIVLLAIGLLYAIALIGAMVVEAVVERSHAKEYTPRLIEDIASADAQTLPRLISESELTSRQRHCLGELVGRLYLPSEMAEGVAKRLLADESLYYQKKVGRSDVISKVAPMVGLMGTLIPLGPGIMALGGGDSSTLSSSLLIAFDTTIAGLVVAALCLPVTRVRSRWYKDYLVSDEALMNALLDWAIQTRAAGLEVPHFEMPVLPEKPIAADGSAVPAHTS